jgi:hypothetical protein
VGVCPSAQHGIADLALCLEQVYFSCCALNSTSAPVTAPSWGFHIRRAVRGNIVGYELS